MSNRPPRSHSSNNQIAIAVLIFWAIAPVILYLCLQLFQPSFFEKEPPLWYLILFGFVAEMGGFLAAGLLCLRNWRTPAIISGRSVWLCFGLGALSYFIGTFWFGYWELVLERAPEITLGDIFYCSAYIFFIIGILLVIKSRRLLLDLWQWVVIVAVSIFAIWFAFYLSTPPEGEEDSEASIEKKAPAWAIATEGILVPYAQPILMFYTLSDVLLLILSTTLILSFWGGQFSRTWLMVALSSIALYVADVWFAYLSAYTDFESGGIVDLFWMFAGVLLALGAVLEYDTSTRSQRR
jgi:hypothetical protein